MKRLFLALLLTMALFVSPVLADEWYTANSVTVRWDAVTTLVSGIPVPATDLVTYSVYTRSVQTAVVVEVATQIAELEAAVTLAIEGDYHVGIRAYRSIPAAGELPVRVIGQSTIGWSSDPLIAMDGETFGVSYYLQLSPITGLDLPQI